MLQLRSPRVDPRRAMGPSLMDQVLAYLYAYGLPAAFVALLIWARERSQ